MQYGWDDSCSKFCDHAFPNKPKLNGFCNMACAGVGILGFIDLLSKIGTDIDPIYFCELLHMCPIHDGGKARVDHVSVTPPSGPPGTAFEIDVFFTVQNQTGSGELRLAVEVPKARDAHNFATNSVDAGLAPGQYAVKYTLVTKNSDQEIFNPGYYYLTFDMCDGMCGAPWPHTALLASGRANFTITVHDE